MIEYKKTSRGDEVMIFHLGSDGFHLTKHPLANPHIKDNRGYRHELDLAALRRIDFSRYAVRLQARLEECAYWPNHWRSIIAFPGLPGKTWWESIGDLVRDHELDMVQYLRALFGGGTIYRVTRRWRSAFFQTDMGRKSAIFDRKEGCWAIYAPIFPDKPLIRLDGPHGFTSGLIPPELQTWKDELEYHMAVSVEEHPSRHLTELLDVFENEDDETTRELAKFCREFRVVRWKPGI